jgi:hypothetical protein
METKYYTPNIEEFHVGFEYEIFEDFDNLPEKEWVKLVWDNQHLNPENMTYPFPIAEDKIRVKYLDREDIESLGFNTEDNETCYNMEKGFDIYGLYPLEDNLIEICKFTNTLFKGMVKNKSELKRILKMLNIE